VSEHDCAYEDTLMVSKATNCPLVSIVLYAEMTVSLPLDCTQIVILSLASRKQISHWHDPRFVFEHMIRLQASPIRTAERVGRNWLPAKEMEVLEESREHTTSSSYHSNF
jgi:hypothetical protein